MTDNHAWFKYFPGAITVTDQDGTILEMNEESAKMFKKDGGYELIGQNALTCHPESIQSEVRKIYDSASLNIYSIKKNGKKTLVYQAPYFVHEEFSGMVEICLDMPEDIPHFDRDNPK